MTEYRNAARCLEHASAWTCWWAGYQIGQDVYFLGWSILAWSRFGKVLQFCAGAFILLEIVGPEKLKAASLSIAAWPTPFRKAKAIVKLGDVGRGSLAFVKALPKIAGCLGFIFMPIGLAWVLLFRREKLSQASTFRQKLEIVTAGDSWASWVLMVIVITGFAVIGILLVYSIVIGILTLIVERASSGLSFLSGHTKLLPRAKLASWVFFVLGFWLDFLAS